MTINMKKFSINLILALAAVSLAGGIAVWTLNQEPAASRAGSPTTRIEAALKSLDGSASIERIRESGIPGLQEVFVRTRTGGDEIVYVSDDGKKLIYGELVDLSSRSSDTRKAVIDRRMELLKAAAAKGSIRYAGPVTKKTAYVFVDPSSEFSQMLHRDLAVLNQAGLTIEYLAFPREGGAGEAFKQLSRIWCASDRGAALEAAMKGQVVRGEECRDVVASHAEVAKRLGVDGTPVFVTDDGRQFPGYPSATRVLEAFGLKPAATGVAAAPAEQKVTHAAPASAWVPAGSAEEG